MNAHLEHIIVITCALIQEAHTHVPVILDSPWILMVNPALVCDAYNLRSSKNVFGFCVSLKTSMNVLSTMGAVIKSV